MWKCPKCGAEWPDDHAFCMSCGTEKSSASPVKQKKSGFRFSSFIIGLLAAAVIISAIVAVIKWHPSSDRETVNTSDPKEASASAPAAEAAPISEADNTQVPDSGYTASLIAKGLQYELGDGEKQDYVKAEQCYREAAEAGDARAMALLGRLCLKDFCYHSARSYWHGAYNKYRLDVDHKEQCLEWLRRSARADDALGLYCLGTLYDEYYMYTYAYMDDNMEPFVEYDYDIAVDYYIRAAKLGCSEASERLVGISGWELYDYRYGEGDSYTDGIAEEMAADGDPYALIILGWLEDDRAMRERAVDIALERKDANVLIDYTKYMILYETYNAQEDMDYSEALSHLDEALSFAKPADCLKIMDLLRLCYSDFHEYGTSFIFGCDFDVDKCVDQCIASVMNNGNADELTELGILLEDLWKYDGFDTADYYRFKYDGWTLLQLSAECLLQASERGHIGAMMELSCLLQERGMYDSGEWKSSEDPARFFKVILEAAENKIYPWVCSGEPTIAWMYANGFGTEKDEKKAEYWEKLIDGSSDEAHALYEEAVKYEINRTGRDYKKAFECYKKAAELGDPDAMAELGWIYMDNTGIPLGVGMPPHQALFWELEIEPDPDASYRWLKEAADMNNPSGLAGLGVLAYGKYEDSNEESDYKECRSLLEKAAAQNDSRALMALASLTYEEIFDEGGDDFSVCTEYIEKALAQNDPAVLYCEAYGYYDGSAYSSEDPDYIDGRFSEYNKAIEYFLRCAEMGYASINRAPAYMAYEMLEELCRFEDYYGVKKRITFDLAWAYDVVNLLISENDPNAMYLMGCMYENGVCVEKDLKAAQQWYDKAFEKGFEYKA